MRKRLFCTILTVVAIACGMTSAVCAAALSPEDEEFLVRSVAAEYPDMPYAARVGVISVILNRVEAEDYPRTAAGVISSYRNADGSPRFAERELVELKSAYGQYLKGNRYNEEHYLHLLEERYALTET